mmetsp:Transcript_35309/g.82443  ORF Transcript_35309/g.82443 Transcript_35309/m.82443 type:complete len:213 (-) Transcript_35309:618-1256(-)
MHWSRCWSWRWNGRGARRQEVAGPIIGPCPTGLRALRLHLLSRLATRATALSAEFCICSKDVATDALLLTLHDRVWSLGTAFTAKGGVVHEDIATRWTALMPLSAASVAERGISYKGSTTCAKLLRSRGNLLSSRRWVHSSRWRWHTSSTWWASLLVNHRHALWLWRGWWPTRNHYCRLWNAPRSKRRRRKWWPKWHRPWKWSRLRRHHHCR